MYAPIHSRSEKQTLELGRLLGSLLEGGDAVGLRGDLGSGKTCFVRGLARGLEVPHEVPVTSPSFTLVNQYPGRLELRHADFYRVESYTRLADAGFDDLLDARGVLVVEWPERFDAALPDDRLEIRIEWVSERERRLSLLPRGLRARELAGRFTAQWP
ncbi:MAG: tRNA (adenosine(37)-N6)-threonylcarbamoyltransferase complex ATPase subunit type 1 TsaE [Proteobacteria bacterium]|nr:tRNA (adenosine(37)-N6)-threonylcarbamoyltransferase complex ATPase subunit type 1 TsaE [Pseudomonadota bacterium]